MCRSSKVKIFISIATLNGRCVCYVTAATFVSLRSEGHKHGVSIQRSINLGDTHLRIARESTAETCFLARFFILQSSIISLILEFTYLTFTIFSFDHMTDENRDVVARANERRLYSQANLLQDMFLICKHFLSRGKIWNLPWTCSLTCIVQLTTGLSSGKIMVSILRVDPISCRHFFYSLNYFSLDTQLLQCLLVGTLPARITSFFTYRILHACEWKLVEISMTVVKYRSQQHGRRGPEELVKETIEARVWDRVNTKVAQARHMSSSFYVDLCIVTWLALHTVGAREIWIDQSGSSRRKKF